MFFLQITDSSLQILGIINSDQGLYQCMAANNVGNIQSSAQLIVIDRGMLNIDPDKCL